MLEDTRGTGRVRGHARPKESRRPVRGGGGRRRKITRERAAQGPPRRGRLRKRRRGPPVTGGRSGRAGCTAAPTRVVPRNEHPSRWGRMFCFQKRKTGKDDKHVPQSGDGPELPAARAGGAAILEGEPCVRAERGAAPRRAGLHVLRRAADGQRQAAHRPYPHALHQGHHPPLPHDEGLRRAAQGRLGYARPARGAGGGKAARPRRQGADRGVRRGAVHRGVQEVRVEIQDRVGAHVRPRGLLGGHGGPLRHLRQRLHRVRVVGAQDHL